MKKRCLLLVIGLLFSTLAFAQKSPVPIKLTPLSETDLLKLATFPEYKATPGDQSNTMPSSVDNTTSLFSGLYLINRGSNAGKPPV